MATNHKINIFQVLGSINKKNKKVYTSLNDEEKKGVHPLVIMRWMSGIQSKLQIMLLNEYSNRYIFSLANHKKLLMDTLVACSPGHYTKYNWTKKKGGVNSNTPLLLNLVKEVYNYSSMKAIDCIPLLDDETFLDMAMDLGRQPQEIKDIKKELKKR